MAGTTEGFEQTTARPEDIRAVPVRHYGRWVAAAVILLIAARLIYSIATNANFEWGTIGHFMFDHRIVHGAWLTIELTFLSMVIGILLGVLLATMRLSENPLVAGASSFYIWIFRGTPVLVQILLWYNFSALYHEITFGLPFIHGNANVWITPFRAGLLALGLNEGAYMAEIVRAGLLSVDEGQSEAAHALGMTRVQTLRRIVLPQAMRVIIPPTGNETISMLKTSSLVSVIALAELTQSAKLIYSTNYQTIQLLIVISFWYLAMTSILSIGQYYLERHYGRGSSRADPGGSILAKISKSVFSVRHGQ